jgi:hypothetical protein
MQLIIHKDRALRILDKSKKHGLLSTSISAPICVVPQIRIGGWR